MVNVNSADSQQEQSDSDEEGSMEASSPGPPSGSQPDASESASSSHSSESSGSEGFDSGDSDTSDSGTSSSSAESKKKRKSSKRKRSSKKKQHKRQKRQHRSRSVPRDTTSLEVPKLTGADACELWRTMIELKLKVLKLWSLVVEDVVQDDTWSSAKKRRWDERWLKAQAVIAGSLGPRLAGRYRRLLVNCDPVQLFQEIEKEYNAGSAAKNDILIKTAMFVRKLVKGERVDTYIDDIMKSQEDLVVLGHPLDEAELARLLLTNSLEVFPDLSSELVGARMKSRDLEVGKVRGRLLAREQEENMRLPSASNASRNASSDQASHGAQPVSNPVFQFSNGPDRSIPRPNQNGGKHWQNRNSTNARRHESVKEAMQRRPCSKCGKLGHCHRDCWQNSNNRPQHGGSRGGQTKSGGKSGGRKEHSGPAMLVASFGGSHTQIQSDVAEWCLDSAATGNVCNDLSLFTSISTIGDGPEMLCASGNLVKINQVGCVELNIVNELTGRQEKRLLPDVYFVPEAPANLLSQDYLQTELKYFVSYSRDQSICYLSKKGMRLKFVKVNRLYRVWSPRDSSKQRAVVCSAIVKSKKATPLTVWHKRFDHASESTIVDMAKKQVARGLKIDKNEEGAEYLCLPCLHGKKVRMTYAERLHHASKPLRRLQVDCCTVNEPTIDGCTSFLLVVDEFSRYKWLFLLRQKSEAKQHIIALVNRLLVKYRDRKWRVEEIHSDQGGEFDNSDIQEYCDSEGITLTSTNGYTPQENGIVERANGIVLPKVRALLHMTNLPDLLWGEAALHVVYTLNVTATRVLGGLTPHEKFSGESPDVSCLRTWGSLCYYHIVSGQRSKKKKLSSRMGTAIFASYSPSTRGYKVLDLSTGAVSTHRGGNLIFAEDYTVGRDYMEMLLANAYSHGDHELPARAPLVPMQMQIADVVRLDAVKESILVQQSQPERDQQPSQLPAAIEPTEAEQVVERQTRLGGLVPAPSAPKRTIAESDTVARHQVSRSGRKRKRSSRLHDFEVHFASHKLFKVLQCGLKALAQRRLHSRDVPVPKTYRQAARSKYASFWLAAIAEELESLRKHGVWIVVERSAAGEAAVITNKWVFTVKKDENGFVKRFKARLVVHGFKQKFGVNYNETFAPVIRFDTIRVAIYFAVQRGWSILQYDVKTAFLHGKLAENVFMEMPQGSGSPGNSAICQLIKSLYGLKQAPHVWNKTLHRHLVALGFVRLESDHGLYSLHEKGEIVMLLTVYVDDLLLMGESDRCQAVARKLAANFELVELGPVKYLLGVEVSIDREKGGVFFSQAGYVGEVLRRFHMNECHGVATPEATSAEVEPDSAKVEGDLPYREVVGALQYLVAGSRPDIAHVVRRLGQYMSCFTAVHYAQAKRVLRYLQATKQFGHSMIVTSSAKVDLLRIEAYSDADYANDKTDRQSVSGYVTMINGCVVSYGSRKQGLNAQSTMDAEYVAMNEGARDIMWLRGLCDELKWQYQLPTLWCDNTAAISLSKKPGKHNGSKHVENRFHYVRNLEDRDLLNVQHCRTDEMTADIMTKPLARVKFEYFRSLLGVVHRDEQGGGNWRVRPETKGVVVAWMMVSLQSKQGDGHP